MRSSSLALLIAGTVVAVPAHAAVDGTALNTKFAGAAIATQTNGTGFGDNYSELDQLFVNGDTSAVHLGISGNLEQNGNAIVILFDTTAGGSQTLAAPAGAGAVSNRSGSLTFDDGFLPDYAISLNNSGGTIYADYANLNTNETGYLGSVAVGGGASAAGDVQFGFDNSNTMGVTDSSAANAATATTGLELLINGAKIGLTGSAASINVMAYLTGGGNPSYLSNQFLGGLAAGTANLAGDPVDLRRFAGNQFATVRLPAGGAVPEPGSVALLATGALPLLGLRRRRK